MSLMACVGCGQRAKSIVTDKGAVANAQAPGSCRTCALMRLTLLWIVGFGGAWVAAVYWLIGFGPCGCHGF
jgi:hypothetical protein